MYLYLWYFFILCNKRININRWTAIWCRFSLIDLSDIDLIKITRNNEHFPMDMLEQDEIFDNLRRGEFYWVLHNFNKIITPAWYLRETYSSFLPVSHTRIILGNTIRRAGTDFVFIFNLLIPVKVNKVVTYNWIALLLIKSKSWKWKSLAVPLQNSFLLLTASVQIWRFGWEGLTACFFCELCYRVHLCSRLNWIKLNIAPIFIVSR